MTEQGEPKFIRDIHWKGDLWRQEFYECNEYPLLTPARGVHAVCFTDDNKVVFFKHVDGYNSLPGGGIDHGETVEEGLAREIKEETAAKMLECGMIGYIKSWPINNPERTDYTLRYWAKVKVTNRENKDPSKKSKGKVVADIDNAVEVLGWGEFGKMLIDLSLQAINNK